MMQSKGKVKMSTPEGNQVKGYIHHADMVPAQERGVGG